MGIAGAFADTLEKRGLTVRRNKTAVANIDMLMLGCIKSVFIAPLQAEELLGGEKYSDALKTHKKPLRSKSYFLIFAKNKALPKAQRLRIWEEIAKIRGNENLMPFFIYKYLKKNINMKKLY